MSSREAHAGPRPAEVRTPGRWRAAIGKRRIGSLAIAVLVATNVVLWLSFLPSRKDWKSYEAQVAGEMLSTSAVILLACALVLTTRARWLEPFFGGLDKMYQAHKRAAMLAILVLFGHFFVVPKPGNVPGAQLGIAAFVGMLLIVLVTIAPRMPLIGRFVKSGYHNWYRLHRLIGLFYILGIIHSLLVKNILDTTTVPMLYARVIGATGIATYVYVELIAPRRRRRHPHEVETVRNLNGTTVEVTLKPLAERLRFAAGQFVFVDFRGNPALSEPHPFTVSSSPREDRLRLSIKASGDWTGYLNEHLRPGTHAAVDGCYGMFDYRSGGTEQIWIAGGIGITPFLSWIRDLDSEPHASIDLFYANRSEQDAVYAEEIEAAAQTYDRLRVHVSYSLRDGRLSAEEIASRARGGVAGKDIYLCGPIAMTEGLARRFRKMGVAASHLHYEEFNLR